MTAGDRPSWAPPRTGVRVERRDPWEVVRHGTLAGLIAGLGLGCVAIVASTVLRGDPGLPFDFATAIVVGPEALAPTFPVAASLALGMVIHALLSVLFGVTFGDPARVLQSSRKPAEAPLIFLVQLRRSPRIA